MPVENMEEEGLARIPDLNIAQWIFTCKIDPVIWICSKSFLWICFHQFISQNDKETRDKLMAAITEHNMAPLYVSVCKVRAVTSHLVTFVVTRYGLK